MEHEQSISVKAVVEAKILPTQTPRALGLNWFKNDDSGMCYRIERKNEILVVKESRRSKSHRILKKKKITIKCIDCSATREIAPQDKFQVKRCTECQKEYRKTKRKEYMRRIRSKERE